MPEALTLIIALADAKATRGTKFAVRMPLWTGVQAFGVSWTRCKYNSSVANFAVHLIDYRVPNRRSGSTRINGEKSRRPSCVVDQTIRLRSGVLRRSCQSLTAGLGMYVLSWINSRESSTTLTLGTRTFSKRPSKNRLNLEK